MLNFIDNIIVKVLNVLGPLRQKEINLSPISSIEFDEFKPWCISQSCPVQLEIEIDLETD